MKIAQTFLLILASIFAGCQKPNHIEVGAAPNDMIFLQGSQKETLAIAASMDSAVEFFDLDRPQNPDRVLFSLSADGKSPNPWSLAASSDNRYVYVTLYADHSVGIIDSSTRTILSKVSLSNTALKHPTTIRVFNNHVLVLFTNFIEWPSAPNAAAQYKQGSVAHFMQEGDQLIFQSALELPCKNPSDISIDSLSRPVISCAGSLRFSVSGDLQLDHAAGFATLSPLAQTGKNSSLTMESYLPLSFSPSKIISSQNGTFLLSNTHRQVMFVPFGLSTIFETILIPANPEAPEEYGYFSSFAMLNATTALIADYKSDQLLAFNLDTRVFNPPPWTTPITLKRADSPIFRGPLAIRQKPPLGKNTSFTDFFVLMGLSSEVFSVRVDHSAQYAF